MGSRQQKTPGRAGGGEGVREVEGKDNPARAGREEDPLYPDTVRRRIRVLSVTIGILGAAVLLLAIRVYIITESLSLFTENLELLRHNLDALQNTDRSVVESLSRIYILLQQFILPS